MPITTKALVTRRVEDAVAEKAIMYFDGQFWTSDDFPEFAKDRLFCDFIAGEDGTLSRLDLGDARWEHPYSEFKIWPCSVGIWHDKSVVDVKYDFEQPPVKVIKPYLQKGQTWDDVDWDTWSE